MQVPAHAGQRAKVNGRHTIANGDGASNGGKLTKVDERLCVIEGEPDVARNARDGPKVNGGEALVARNVDRTKLDQPAGGVAQVNDLHVVDILDGQGTHPFDAAQVHRCEVIEPFKLKRAAHAREHSRKIEGRESAQVNQPQIARDAGEGTKVEGL